MIREVQVDYEDKINKLEEEVLRLREEVRHFLVVCFYPPILTPSFPLPKLAKRPAMNSADHSFSIPPPPPPPPPHSRLPLVLPRILTTPAVVELSFSDIRAHLRHAGTPVDVPINAPMTKRVGKPTIGVPADKMAEFLR